MGKNKYKKPVNGQPKDDLPVISRHHADNYRLIRVFVEGYEDVAFWRSVFDDFQTDELIFEISVPPRPDLAKGKRVLLDMIPDCGPDTILCVDSDFDYLFFGTTEQSKLVKECPFLFQTFTYSTENYLCYPPSLHRVCVKATKNDAFIFDFEAFMASYSQIIYPLFLWYAYSAHQQNEKAFTLLDFKSSVRLNYLDLYQDGQRTLEWLQRQVNKRLTNLQNKHPQWVDKIEDFGRKIHILGVTPYNTHLFMQGHTLLDNVVLIILHAVCGKLKEMSTKTIQAGTKQGIALRNEISNYNNSLRNVREVLLDNEYYKDCFLYQRLHNRIAQYVATLK